MTTRYRRDPTIEAAPTQDETILFNPASNRFCHLNRSAAVLWAKLEQPSTVAELTTAMCEAYDIDAASAGEDVRDAIRTLEELQLITTD